MAQALPKHSYLFAKLDKEFRHTYVNDLYQSLLKLDNDALLGRSLHDVKSQAMPQCLLDELLDRVDKKGYAYALVPNACAEGTIYWGFIDLTRRFGAAADSGMIGYELVSYPASTPLIEFFAPLYQELLQHEQQQHPPSAVLEHFYQRVAQSGKSYDELVHTLQNA